MDKKYHYFAAYQGTRKSGESVIGNSEITLNFPVLGIEDIRTMEKIILEDDKTLSYAMITNWREF